MFKLNLEREQKNLLIAHNLRLILSIFKSTFLSLYFYQVLEQDIIKLAVYNIIYVTFNLIFYFIIYKKISNKNINIIYKLSFLSMTIIFIILLFLKENLLQLAYIIAILEAFTTAIYWSTYQLYLYNVSKGFEEIKNYMTMQIMSKYIINILSVLFFGSMITFRSYIDVFIILVIIGGFSIIASIYVKNIQYEKNSFEIKKFTKKVKTSNKFYRVYISDFLEGLSYNDGALEILLKLIIFIEVTREFEFGIWTTIFSILTIITTIFINKKHNRKKFSKMMLISAIILNIVTIQMLLKNQFVFIVIYNILYSILFPFIETLSESYSMNIINQEKMQEYKQEHLFVRECVLTIGRVLSFSILILIALFNNESNMIVMKILAIVLTFAIILKALQFVKIEKYI